MNVIEKGIPIPAAQSTGKTATLKAMEVGDSVAVIPAQINTWRCTFCRVPNAKFVARMVDGGARVWRIA